MIINPLVFDLHQASSDSWLRQGAQPSGRHGACFHLIAMGGFSAMPVSTMTICARLAIAGQSGISSFSGAGAKHGLLSHI
jgi:hypothetical protein